LRSSKIDNEFLPKQQDKEMAKEYKKEVLEAANSINSSLRNISKLFKENNKRNIELDTLLMEKLRNESANIHVRNQQIKYIIRMAQRKKIRRESVQK
jgi:hypothetical protein